MGLVVVGCEDLDSVFNSDDDGDSNVAPPAAQAAAEAAVEGAQAATGGPIDLSKVVWLHNNVSGWPQTSTLSSVNVSGGSITLNYDKARSWRGVNTAAPM